MLEDLFSNRIVAALVVVIVVPIVLVGYILARRSPVRGSRRDAGRPKLRPWLWIAPALSFLGRLPRLPDDLDDPAQLQEPKG